MKKFIPAFVLGLAMFIAGCQTPVTPESVGTISTLLGATTGQAFMMAGLDAKQHNAVYEVVKVVRDVTPKTNETYQAACNRIAEPIVDKAIADGKLPAESKALVMSAANTIGIGIDYMFIKHPTWKEDETLVKIAIQNFCDGFLAVVKPVNSADALQFSAPLDGECFKYVRARM